MRLPQKTLRKLPRTKDQVGFDRRVPWMKRSFWNAVQAVETVRRPVRMMRLRNCPEMKPQESFLERLPVSYVRTFRAFNLVRPMLWCRLLAPMTSKWALLRFHRTSVQQKMDATPVFPGVPHRQFLWIFVRFV